MKLEVISKQPRGVAHSVPLLFVHGAWHGAWCWDTHILDYFADRGFAAHALSLRGHGESEGRDGLRWARVRGYVDDVARVAAQLSAPPVVIGHSMGGFVVQKYLERFAPPAAVLLASVPPQGVWLTTLRLMLRHPLRFLWANLTLSLYPLVATPALAREAFFSPALGEAEVAAYWRKLQDESFLAFLDMLALDLPKPPKQNTPVLVLGAQNDTIFDRNQIEATARAYGTAAQWLDGVAHDAMLDAGWQSGAERMHAWLLQVLPASDAAAG
jgi:pimeloyl-ACP methyl ester carboxylesterase